MAVDKKIKDDTARAVQSFFRARTLENIQNFGLAPLDAIFGVLEGKGSDQIAQSAASVMVYRLLKKQRLKKKLGKTSKRQRKNCKRSTANCRKQCWMQRVTKKRLTIISSVSLLLHEGL